MTQATVRWFDPKKGFGFVITEDGADAFLHFTQIRMEGFRTLEAGQRVSCEIEESPKGPAYPTVLDIISRRRWKHVA